MSLDQQIADRVLFECQRCGLEHTLRKIRKFGGRCHKCDGSLWSMITEYHEGEQSVGVGQILLAIVFGINTLQRHIETIRLTTPNVSSMKAVELASAGMVNHKRAAFKYMDLRRELDGERDRDIMRQYGGTNCRGCGMFFMPSPDKPWTQSNCCSKACYAQTGAAPLAATEREVERKVPENAGLVGKIAIVCSCGQRFEVASMYVGSLRACPACGAKTMVS